MHGSSKGNENGFGLVRFDLNLYHGLSNSTLEFLPRNLLADSNCFFFFWGY